MTASSSPFDETQLDDQGSSDRRNADESDTTDPDATVDDAQLTPDPEATLDDLPETVEAQTDHESENTIEEADPDATYTPVRDVPSTIKEWDASLSEDVNPEHTIKVPQSSADFGGATLDQSVVLKRRDVSRQDDAMAQADVPAGDDADYRIDQLLGEGGMGAVYAARQQSMDRPVAIKVLKSRAGRLESSQQAFVSEAIITGGLDHPNIVPIYDVGKQANDAIFYAMKQVEGVEWRDRFASNSVAENLDILLRVSDAIAFAHARCILHRDLKPANIMLGPYGEVLVMDWGLAMPTQDHPRCGSFPRAKRGGTPHYMAPEMAGDPDRVDRRSDVYLLGGILFEIVTGKAPHVLDSPPQSRREHVKACLAAVAQNEIASTDESGELIDIARTALATDPADRYQTVPEFQSAIREYLAHEESIELAARAADRLGEARQSQSYDEFSRARFGFEAALEEWPGNERATTGLRETRRHYAHAAFDRGDFDLALSLLDESDAEQAKLGSSILQAIVERDARQQHIRRLRRVSFATSLGVTIVAISAAVWINSERSKALTAQQEEASQREIAQEQRQAAIKAQERAETSEEEARQNLKTSERNAYGSDMLLVHRDWDDASTAHLNETLDRYRDRDDLRGFEWGYWDQLAHSDLLTLNGHTNWATCVVFSPDGTRLASASEDKTVKLWDAVTGQEIRTFQGHTDRVYSVSFSPDGTRLASASYDKTIKLWDVATGQETLTLKGHASFVHCVSFSPDGTRLASGSFDKTVKLWDVTAGQSTLTLKGHTDRVHSVAFSPDGTRLASASKDKTVKLWDMATGEETLTLKGDTTRAVWCVAFSPDGTRLASANGDGPVNVWNAATGQPTLTLNGHTKSIRSVSFSPDGSRLASASFDRTVKVWDTATGQETQTLKGHTGFILSAAFSPDGTRLASASIDQTVKVWNAATSQETLTFKGHTEAVHFASFSRGGTRLASASYDNTVKVWDVATGQETLTLEGHTGNVYSVSFSPDGTRLASASWDKTVKVWDAATGKETFTLEGHDKPVRGVAFSPDGSRLASASDDKTVKVWDVAKGEETLTLRGHTIGVHSVAFSPDGTRLASASGTYRQSEPGELKVWNATTGETVFTINGNANRTFGLSFSPDGTRLAVARGKAGLGPGEVMVLDAATGEVTHTLKGHTRRVICVAFSPDGTRLASASGDLFQPGEVKVWDAETGRETLTFKGHSEFVYRVAFSPDGMRLATASYDGTVMICDARPWTPELRVQSQARGYLTVHRDRVKSLEELQAAVRMDETISNLVRKQALDWSELFWKPMVPPPIVSQLVRQLTADDLPSSALEFDGRTQQVSVPSIRYDGSHPLTLEAFVTPDAMRHTILGDTERSGIGLGLRDGTYGILVWNGSRYDVASARDAATHLRVHVAGTFDERMLRIFVDGQLLTTSQLNGTFKSSGFPMTIGASPSPNSAGIDYAFKGVIDQVRISRTARYTDDFKVPARFEADEDTLAVYHFDEGQGEILGDASGNGHDGEVRGAKWVTSRAIRKRAALGLAKLGRHGVTALAAALTHQNPEVRIEAASALGTIGPTASAAIAALKAAATDEDKSVQDAAELALSQIESTFPNE